MGASFRFDCTVGDRGTEAELVERAEEHLGGATETSSTSVAHNGGGQVAVPEVRKSWPT